MTEKAEDNVETLPDLDDLLQCPVCYEIPSGQIFQCNEGHHVCGRCKMRLDVCPVCRAFFFGTRNYAMEELIANVKKLRAFKLGGKVTTGTPPTEAAPEAAASSSEDNESTNEIANEEDDVASQVPTRPPAACSGLFRCLCCKNNPERLPIARLLNHLRYFHSPDLIEGRSEEGGYLQAWQFPTAPGRLVTALRVHDMGIFFLVIEISHESVHAWLSMAAAAWVTRDFSYTFTLSGNDREAIFTDCVWSVRSCEGTLKKRGRCLCVSGADGRALLAPSAMSGKLSVRRLPAGVNPLLTEPRAVLRVANRSHAPAAAPDLSHDLEPFLQDLQNDVARLSRAFATLGREANALVRSEAEMRARSLGGRLVIEPEPETAERAVSPPPALENGERQLSRNARRRMRQRLREAFRENQASEPAATATAPAAPGPIAAPRTVTDRNTANLTRSHTIQTSNIPNLATRPNSHQIANRQSEQVNGGARVSGVQVVTSANARAAGASAANASANFVAARANTNQNANVPARATNGPAPVVHSIGFLRVVSPTERAASPPVTAPAPAPAPAPASSFGGPSQNQTTNGNSRNKKKRRQRR